MVNPTTTEAQARKILDLIDKGAVADVSIREAFKALFDACASLAERVEALEQLAGHRGFVDGNVMQ